MTGMVTGDCDACGEEQEWTVERNLRHADCHGCDTQHIISISECEACRDDPKSEAEQEEMFEKLQKRDKEVFA